MAWRDQSRGRRDNYGGDSYRPSDRPRSRSRHRHYDDRDRNVDLNTRPRAPGRTDSSIFGYDGAPPPARGSVTPSLESPRSPNHSNRDDTRPPPPMGPAAMVKDPRLAKKQLLPLKSSNGNGAITPIASINDFTATASLKQTEIPIKSTAFMRYLELLAELAQLHNNSTGLENQIAEQEQQKRTLLELHPEAKEIQVQIKALIEQLRARLNAVNDTKKSKQAEITIVFNTMSPRLKDLFNGTLPEAAPQGHTASEKEKLDFAAICSRLDVLENKDKLREIERQELEKSLLAEIRAKDEHWQFRLTALEERDRKREDEMKATKAELEALRKNLTSFSPTQIQDELSELKATQKEHKHIFANLANLFVPTSDFKELHKSFITFKQEFDPQTTTALNVKLGSVEQKMGELENEHKTSKKDISILVSNVTEVKGKIAHFEQLEGQYTTFWNGTNQRLSSLEQMTATSTTSSTLQDLKALETKVDACITSGKTRQDWAEEQFLQLRSTADTAVQRPVFDSLQSEVKTLAKSFDQRFPEFIAKTQQDVQAILKSYPTITPSSTSAEDRKILDNLVHELPTIKLKASQAEFAIKALNARYNSISGSALCKDILHWATPTVTRIPQLEQSNKDMIARISKMEEDVTRINVDISNVAQKVSQPQQHNSGLNKEASGKIEIIEARVADLSRSQQQNQASIKHLNGLQTRLERVEGLGIQLPSLYYTKENGDDLDKRFHILESMEIKGDLEDLRQKHAIIKKQHDEQQLDIDDHKDEIKSLREAQDTFRKFTTESKSVCDARQQELDAREGEVEALTTRLSSIEKVLSKLTDQVERVDEEAKVDISTMKEEIAKVIPADLALLHLEHLASRVKTADDVRSLLDPFTIYHVWFGGGKNKQTGSTTYQAIVVVNKVDALQIKTIFDNKLWLGRSVRLSLIDDNSRLEDLCRKLHHSAPAPDFSREGTIALSVQSPLGSRAHPISPLARTSAKGTTPGIVQKSESIDAASSVLVSSGVKRPGSKNEPVVIRDSQEQEQSSINSRNVEIEHDGNDTIEVRKATDSLHDPEDINAWKGRPPSKSKATDSPARTTPSSSRKRPNQEGGGGTSKKARKT